MSWDSYVDNLTSNGSLDKACIWGNTADSDWTATAKNNFKLDREEVKKVVEIFNDTGDSKKVLSEGFYAGGHRWVAIRADDKIVHGKKDKEGVLIYKTNKTFIIGHYPEGVHAGNAVNVIEPIGSYLEGIQY